MVQLTPVLYKFTPKWMSLRIRRVFLRKQQLFKLTYSSKGRYRNCWKHAQINLFVRYRLELEERKKNRKNMRHLSTARIQAALDEYDYPFEKFALRLPLLGIELDRKALANLSIWEPRSFESLVEIAKKYEPSDYKNLK